MSHSTKYSLDEINSALDVGNSLRIVNNGWINLNSSISNPTDLDTLTTPGNYLTSFWSNGPAIGNVAIIPLNITITLINNNLYQMINIANDIYYRIMQSGSSVYGEWTADHLTNSVTTGAIPPASLVEGESLWLDTSDPTKPQFKLYINSQWAEIIPAGAMQCSIYDSQGRKTDIFNFIDNAISEGIDSTAIVEAYNNHVSNTDIHLSEEKRIQWDNAIDTSTLTNTANEFHESISGSLPNLVSEGYAPVDELTSNATTLNANITTHIANNTVHPDSATQAVWTAKADSAHTHWFDNRVTLDENHISGEIATTVLPYETKERVYLFSNTSDIYNVTKNPFHNGDWFCVELSTGDAWYFVMDDTQLGLKQFDTNVYQVDTATNARVLSDLPTIRAVRSFCYGKGVYIGIPDTATTDYLLSSVSGIYWVQTSISSQTNDFFDFVDVVYGNDKFIALTKDGTKVVYSTDGNTWTVANTSGLAPSLSTVFSMCYGNGLFVSVTNSAVCSSTDGITWANKYSLESESITPSSVDIIYTEGVFIGLAEKLISNSTYGIGPIPDDLLSPYYGLYSSDGETWSYSILGSNSTHPEWGNNSISLCNGKDTIYAAVYTNTPSQYLYYGYLEKTNISNPSKWEIFTSIQISTGATKWYASGNNNIAFAVSDAGTIFYFADSTEIAISDMMTPVCTAINFDNFKFIIETSNGLCCTSTDGINWEVFGTPIGEISYNAYCYGEDKFIALRPDTDEYVYSKDSVVWESGKLSLDDISLTPYIEVISSEHEISETTRSWTSICYGNGKYVAIASNSNVSAYSTDGITWTETTMSETDINWRSVCYGNGKYVAVTYSSNISAYSTDGINWTESTISDNNRYWISVCYGDGKYVAVAWGGNIAAYSTDGITWVETTISETTEYWKSVCYGNGKYVAVTENSNVSAYSTDGINWTETTISDSTSKKWTSVCYGDGKFVAVVGHAFNSNIAAYSTDGITWTETTISETSRYWQSVCYGNGKYVAVVAYSNIFAYSTDGITWYETTISDTEGGWQSVCYGDGKYVTVDYGGNIAVSITLTDQISKYIDIVTYGNNKYIAINNTSKFLLSSTDGINWTENAYPFTAPCYYITYGNNKFVAVENLSSSTARLLYSIDGLTWTASSNTYPAEPSILVYGNGTFVVMSSNATTAMYSQDGVSWTTETLVSERNINWKDVAYGNGIFIAVENSNYAWHSVDGITWFSQPIDSEDETAEWCAVSYGNGKFAVLKNNSNIVAYSMNGVTWELVEIPITENWSGLLYGNNRFVAIPNTGSAFTVLNPYIDTPALKELTKTSKTAVDWANITNIPTTAEGFGITDAVTYDDFNQYIEEIQTVAENLPTDLDFSGLDNAATSYTQFNQQLESYIAQQITPLDSGIASLENIVGI